MESMSPKFACFTQIRNLQRKFYNFTNILWTKLAIWGNRHQMSTPHLRFYAFSHNAKGKIKFFLTFHEPSYDSSHDFYTQISILRIFALLPRKFSIFTNISWTKLQLVTRCRIFQLFFFFPQCLCAYIIKLLCIHIYIQSHMYTYLHTDPHIKLLNVKLNSAKSKIKTFFKKNYFSLI